jgi:hypothetical protein
MISPDRLSEIYRRLHGITNPPLNICSILNVKAVD